MMYFPEALMRETSLSTQLVHSTIASVPSLNNVQPVITVDAGGLWMMNLSSVRLRTPAQIRLWWQMVTALEGGLNPIEVRMCMSRYGPFPGGVYAPISQVPFDDNALFDDNSGFYQPIVVGQVDGTIPLRSTQFAITFVNGSINTAGLQGGEFFSIEHPTKGLRLYQVTRIVSGTFLQPTIEFRPPLRDVAPNDTYLDFDRPGCTMQLASQDAGTLQLDLRRTATPSVSFVEAFPPDQV